MSSSSVRPKLALGAVAAVAAPLVLTLAPTPSAAVTGASTPACDGRFDPGAEQACKVASGITKLNVLAVGEAGNDDEAPGGYGARITTTIPVTAGETLYVEVGVGGGRSRVAGAGGGAATVQTCSVDDSGCVLTGDTSTDPRLVVAGGGGGAGSGEQTGGRGGRAGITSLTGAGAGGDTGGENGHDAGLGGTAGGAGGKGSNDTTHPDGGSGGAGVGGSVPGTDSGTFSAGGGGGGFWGGGAGGGGANAGGGGAGSSFVEASATNTKVGFAKQPDPDALVKLAPAALSISAATTSSSGKTKFGWFRSPVTVTYTCNPGQSAYADPGCPAPVKVAGNGVHTVTRSVSNTGGQTATATTKVRVDKVAPKVTIHGVRSGHRYSKPPTVTCKAHDALSGLAKPCTVTTTSHHARVHYRAVARDKAGNVTSVGGHYKLKGGTQVVGSAPAPKGPTHVYYTDGNAIYRAPLADHSKATKLFTAPKHFYFTSIKVSPDHRRIAGLLDGNAEYDVPFDGLRLVERPISGGHWRTLAKGYSGTVGLEGISWAPDSKSIYFGRSTQRSYYVQRVPVTGKPKATRVKGSTNLHYPAVSPDGRFIIAAGIDKDQDDTQLVRLSLTTGHRRLLAKSANGYSAPAFSPNGKMVAFDGASAGSDSGGIDELELGVKGAKPVTVVADDECYLDGNPAWRSNRQLWWQRQDAGFCYEYITPTFTYSSTVHGKKWTPARKHAGKGNYAPAFD